LTRIAEGSLGPPSDRRGRTTSALLNALAEPLVGRAQDEVGGEDLSIPGEDGPARLGAAVDERRGPEPRGVSVGAHVRCFGRTTAKL